MARLMRYFDAQLHRFDVAGHVAIGAQNHVKFGFHPNTLATSPASLLFAAQIL
ncbi:MAG: hypothetical protein ACI91Z_000184 [Yoonia sp.]|jgi:hypothetical protein